jgi:hypothetical protein
MRFERLQEDFTDVMRGVGIVEDVTVPQFNATHARTAGYQSYYTLRARRLVEYIFKSDLERYGYSFEGATAAAASRSANR